MANLFQILNQFVMLYRKNVIIVFILFRFSCLLVVRRRGVNVVNSWSVKPPNNLIIGTLTKGVAMIFCWGGPDFKPPLPTDHRQMTDDRQRKPNFSTFK
jgi:hypothetical protein